jgi:flagellar hook-associated protein 3 FlgL
MRVTENTNFNTVRDSITRTKGKMEDLQTQSATLKKINTPSDDPVSATKILELRTDKVNNDQFLMNAKMAESALDNTDHALSEISDILVRAKEIALGQASGASANEESRLGIAEEVSQLYSQAISIGNTRIGDRYIFGGYKTNRPPFDDNGRYQGDDGQQMVEISKDVYLSMNVPGLEAFNTNPKNSADSRAYGPNGGRDATMAPNRGPASALEDATGNPKAGPDNVNAFDELQNLRISLLTGDLNGIQNTLERLDQIHGKVVATRAKVGSRMQGLQSANQSIERHNVTNAQLNSSLEDADMAQVVSDLAKEETVFRSALQSSHKLIQPTLLDFLK